MAGATIICRTVYGDPCTIELLEDGRMRGRAGYANEDCDHGRWWVEGARWNRQWEHWAYGEATAYFVVIEGERIKWFDSTHRQVDSAIIQQRVRSRLMRPPRLAQRSGPELDLPAGCASA